MHFLNDCVRYDLRSQKLLNNLNALDFYTNGTMNNNYRPSDLRLDKTQMYLVEHVHDCMSLPVK